MEWTKSYIQRDKQIKGKPDVEWNKRGRDFWARSHPAKLPTSEKKLKRSLGSGIVVHAFDPSTQKAEADRYLHFRQPGFQGEIQNSQT